jgi:hypothetical protein
MRGSELIFFCFSMEICCLRLSRSPARSFLLKLRNFWKAEYSGLAWKAVNKSPSRSRMFLFWLNPSAREWRLIMESSVMAYLLSNLISFC